MRKLLALMCLAVLTAGTVSAKEMTTKKASDVRVGIGFSNQLSNQELTSLAARFWVTDSYGFEGLFGFRSGDERAIDFGGKFLGVLKHEKNLTLYGFGLLGIENYENKPAEAKTTTTVGAGAGVEFFLQGLPNLSFSAETGLGYSNFNDDGAFGTFGNWLSSVGLRYYIN